MAKVAALTLAAGACGGAAWLLASEIERRSVADVEVALLERDADFATARADGLQLVLTGTAPDEAARFRAVTAAGTAVDPARVIDAMRVVPREGISPPRVSLQILRNDAGVSLIGLVPEGIGEELARRARGMGPLSDMVESSRPPAPEGWDEALGFALDALEALPRSKIGVEAGRVEITAVAETDEERRRLEARISRDRPEGVALSLDIAGPRPVFAPFALRFVDEDGRVRFEGCAADSEAARQAIVTAAAAAGLTGKAECLIGLGVPTPRWGEAVAAGIGAVAKLGGGRLAFSDTDVTLRALPGTDRARFEAVATELERTLPEVFTLQAVPPAEAAADGEVASARPELVATRSPEGEVRVRGHLGAEMQEAAAVSYGRALFGVDRTLVSGRPHDDLPDGWSTRVLAGLEALSHLHSGAVTVTPDAIEVTGRTGTQEAEAVLAGLLARRLGADVGAAIDVTYQEELDPLLGIPTPEECVDRLNGVLELEKITFAPGKAVIEEGASDLMGDLAAQLRECRRSVFEVEGHTDSQGRETMNLELSQARADAVRTALIGRGVPPEQVVAEGYGESRPIADNDTAEGREANRRISFSLLDEDSAAIAAEAMGAAPPAAGEAEVAPADPPEDDG
jgi:OOP family OmpA-OmpF porin